MIRIRHYHALAFFLVVGFVIAASFSFSQKVAASGSQTFTSSGTFTVPAYGTLTVEVWGGGASGGGANGVITSVAGNSGTQSSFADVVAGGGTGPAGGSNTNGLTGGAGGTASGGDTNTSGGAGGNGSGDFCPYAPSGAGGSSPNGGAGGAGISTNVPAKAGSTPGGGGGGGLGAQYQPQQRLWYCRGAAGGGAGAYAIKTYSAGALAVGSSVTVTVGSGGAAPSAAGPGGAGATGEVTITWTDPIATPTCTLTPSSQTITSGEAASLSYTISGSATSASINGTSVATTASGSYAPSPTTDTSYTMTVANAGGPNTCGPVTVIVNAQGQSDVITGWAWSDTVGWISLSGLSFGISIDANGDLSGYAWSDNIGWISANEDDLDDCPQGACKAKLSGNNLQGWMRALSQDGNGWDGWISLKGSGYGPTVSGGNFSGYAWGSDVVGWIDFANARTEFDNTCTPTLSCTNSTTLHSTCPLPSGTDTACDSGQMCSVNACVDTYSCLDTHTIVNDRTGATTNCPAPLICSAGSPTCVNAPAVQVIGALEARPSLVLEGDTTFLFWDIDNVVESTCSVEDSSGVIVSEGASSSGENGVETDYIESQTIFTLACTGEDGELFTESATVNVVPLWGEF